MFGELMVLLWFFDGFRFVYMVGGCVFVVVVDGVSKLC